MFSRAGDPIVPDDLDDVSTEVLAEEIQTLAGHIAAATCGFLVMLGEFDRRDAYERWECLSAAHWLNWRCGMSMTAAREQVRVARRLRELPVVLAAFSRGQLSYSKVRAIARVANDRTEADLVSVAQHATAQQVEVACRAIRRCEDAREEEQRLRDGEDAAAARAMLCLSRSDGVLSGRLRLGVAESEVVTRALDTALEDLTDDGPDGPPESIDARRARALAAIAAAYLANPNTGPGPQPELIVHVDAAGLAATGPATGPAPGPTHDSADSHDDDSAESPGVAPLEQHRWPVRLSSGAAISLALLARLACDAGIRHVADLPDGTQLNLGRHRRVPDPPLRRALLARDVHCRFPGCHTRRNLHAHHIIWWILGGRTDTENLLMLCPKHHAAIHTRHWTLTGTATHPVFSGPDGHTVDPHAPPLHGTTAELIDAHDQHGLDIAVDHVGGRWHGDHMDWDCFFAGITSLNRPPGVPEVAAGDWT